MKKILFISFLLLTLVFGCASNAEGIMEDDSFSSGSTVTYMTLGTTSSRLMVYEGDLNISSEDLTATFNDIIALLQTDEWILSQSINEDYARLVLKIDASRLSDFIALLREDFEVTSVDISAEDITKIYQDTESEIATYEAERTRLLELYESASLSDMITINSRISSIDQALNELRNDQEERETDIQYSTLNIFIRESHVFEALPFSEEVSDAFSSGLNALVGFFQGIIIVFVVLIPWMILIVPATFLGIIVYKKNIKHRIPKPLKEEKS